MHHKVNKHFLKFGTTVKTASEIHMYVDASFRNVKMCRYKAAYCIFIDNDKQEIIKRTISKCKSSQRAEAEGIRACLRLCKNINTNYVIHTDALYIINHFTVSKNVCILYTPRSTSNMKIPDRLSRLWLKIANGASYHRWKKRKKRVLLQYYEKTRL